MKSKLFQLKLLIFNLFQLSLLSRFIYLFFLVLFILMILFLLIFVFLKITWNHFLNPWVIYFYPKNFSLYNLFFTLLTLFWLTWFIQWLLDKEDKKQEKIYDDINDIFKQLNNYLNITDESIIYILNFNIESNIEKGENYLKIKNWNLFLKKVLLVVKWETNYKNDTCSNIYSIFTLFKWTTKYNNQDIDNIQYELIKNSNVIRIVDLFFKLMYYIINNKDFIISHYELKKLIYNIYYTYLWPGFFDAIFYITFLRMLLINTTNRNQDTKEILITYDNNLEKYNLLVNIYKEYMELKEFFSKLN